MNFLIEMNIIVCSNWIWSSRGNLSFMESQNWWNFRKKLSVTDFWIKDFWSLFEIKINKIALNYDKIAYAQNCLAHHNRRSSALADCLVITHYNGSFEGRIGFHLLQFVCFANRCPSPSRIWRIHWWKTVRHPVHCSTCTTAVVSLTLDWVNTRALPSCK